MFNNLKNYIRYKEYMTNHTLKNNYIFKFLFQTEINTVQFYIIIFDEYLEF